MAIMFLAVLIAAILSFILSVLNDNSTTKYFYKKNLTSELQLYEIKGKKFVKLSFKSFASMFSISPESWEIKGVYLKNLKHISVNNQPECYVIFENRKDYIKAKSLYKNYQNEKEKRIASKKEIEDFESFKKIIQFDIEQKKKEAEQEIEKANNFLNSL